MSKEALVKALHHSVESFQEERRKYPGELDLSGADLSGANLLSAQLGRANLKGVNFSDCDLTNANLSHSQLQGAIFHSAKIINVNLHKAELEGADFRGAIFGGMEEDGRMCINQWMFCNVKWGKEQLEYFLSVLNKNNDWEIKYELLPKGGDQEKR